jgi:transposase InsO family protein
MTALAGVSRATYYRLDPEATAAIRDIELRDAMQRIALRFPAYGRRASLPNLSAGAGRQTISAWAASCVKTICCVFGRKKFHATTDSKHGFPVYPNLTRNFVPAARNQLWVADITYIRLAEEFVYLAVVLDAYSRLVIGWALERTLEAKLTIGALQMALDKRGSVAGLIHHSDRGVQYACREYMQVLKDHGLQISMSRKANPYDNAKAESFMKTLKHEEVHRVEYRDLAEARRGVRHFLERTYNRKRLHSALGYRPPSEFDALPQGGKIPA